MRERKTIEEQVQMERQKKSLEKESALKKELEFKGKNYELIQLTHAHKDKDPPAPEHPFIRLCD